MIDVIQADITSLDVDAIVNAANESLAPGGGVCGAIHRVAGPELARACARIGRCPTGDARLTPGFGLRARFVIHAVGPVWRDGAQGEPRLLAAAYDAVFRVARAEPGIRSLALPAISTGIYGFPRDQAAAMAVQAIRGHESDFDRVVCCLFDPETMALYQREVEVSGDRS